MTFTLPLDLVVQTDAFPLHADLYHSKPLALEHITGHCKVKSRLHLLSPSRNCIAFFRQIWEGKGRMCQSFKRKRNSDLFFSFLCVEFVFFSSVLLPAASFMVLQMESHCALFMPELIERKAKPHSSATTSSKSFCILL